MSAVAAMIIKIIHQYQQMMLLQRGLRLLHGPIMPIFLQRCSNCIYLFIADYSNSLTKIISITKLKFDLKDAQKLRQPMVDGFCSVDIAAAPKYNLVMVLTDEECMSCAKTGGRADNKHLAIFALSVIGACRIFLFSAAFPFFNNVDEETHFDLVFKYSRGHIPCCGVENVCPGVAELIAVYGTPEYFAGKEQVPDRMMPPPLWTYPNFRKSAWYIKEVSKWQQKTNHEWGSFPAYYLLAGLWYNFGRLLGIEGGNLLYWVRFLNVPLFAVLVWFSYFLARRLFADNYLLQIGLPLMAAFFPQDVFYSVNSDTISPLLFAVSFYMLLQIYFEQRSYWYHLFGGLFAAAAFLAKFSNVAVLVLLGLIIVLKVRLLVGRKEVRPAGRAASGHYLPRLITLASGATVPISVWLVRNYIVFGDFTATADKIKDLGWTVKPLSQLWNHPIFSLRGVSFFATELTKTFWRGEFIWHLEPVASAGMDQFYIISTVVFIFICGTGLVLSRNKTDKRHRFVLGMSFCVLVVSVLFLAALSMLYDFGDCWYPSREKPYFTSGRLISGVLLPFLVIYLDGLGRLCRRLSARTRQGEGLAVALVNPLIIAAFIAIVITCSELLLNWEVFKSQYNWFGLR